MNIAILGNLPTYMFADQLGIDKKKQKRITSWNENLLFSLGKNKDIKLHFITLTKEISHTITINKDDNIKVTYLVVPKRFNLLTLFKYTQIKINKILREFKPDIIHGIGTEHIWGYIASKSKIPNVVTLHGIMNQVIKNSNSPKFYKKRFFAYLERKTLKQCNNIIIINPYVENVCEDYLNKNANKYFIENPISDIYRKTEITNYSQNKILFIGDFEDNKNVLELINAVNQDEFKNIDFKIKIIGKRLDDIYYNKVLDIINNHKQLNERISITSFLLPTELVDEYKSSGILVLTSKEENAPMVIAEAMSMGLSVVSYDVGGIKNMINHGNDGYVIRFGDIKTLSKTILTLLLDEKLRRRIGKQARKNAKERYSPELIASKTLKAYKEIIKHHEK